MKDETKNGFRMIPNDSETWGMHPGFSVQNNSDIMENPKYDFTPDCTLENSGNYNSEIIVKNNWRNAK